MSFQKGRELLDLFEEELRKESIVASQLLITGSTKVGMILSGAIIEAERTGRPVHFTLHMGFEVTVTHPSTAKPVKPNEN